MTKDAQGVWVVGYGSLIYKPPPHWRYKVNGILHGFLRRFWQSSIDHRGTPDSPGRVATLMPYSEIIKNDAFKEDLDEGERRNLSTGNDLQLLARAYYIPPEHVQSVTEYLDVREQNGYTAHKIHIHLEPPRNEPQELQDLLNKLPIDEVTGKHILDSMVYIGTSDNEAFIGPEKLQDTASVIAFNEGPSGPNYEYLELLHDSLVQMANEIGKPLKEIEDSYLESLLQCTKKIRDSKKSKAAA